MSNPSYTLAIYNQTKLGEFIFDSRATVAAGKITFSTSRTPLDGWPTFFDRMLGTPPLHINRAFDAPVDGCYVAAHREPFRSEDPVT